MNRDLYEKILNELLELNEFSTMGGGAVQPTRMAAGQATERKARMDRP